MSKRNPDYDFKWCPGCGDFGVVRGVELALTDRAVRLGESIEKSVIVAGIGCSGNLVHLQEGPQPFGIHGIHGRTLPMAYGIKASRPDLNVLVVAGDGDFLSIGGEHIGPQAKRNLDITVVVMDNGVYGLTKGQASPTTEFGAVTPTTPYGKLEDKLNPLALYLALGVSHIVSAISSKPKVLADYIGEAMDYPGFSIVHVQSPCTTYNDTYETLRGNPEKGIEAEAYDLPDSYDPSDPQAAMRVAQAKGVPLGVVYKKPESESVPMMARLEAARERTKVRVRSVEQILNTLKV